MARWLTVLIAMVAQGMALMSPVCFVRCVGADGHECIELAGRGCHCTSCSTCESLPQVCAVPTCGEHRHDHDQAPDDEQPIPEGWQARCEHCSCRHSPLEAGQQLRNKSLTSDVLLVAHNVLLAPMAFVAVVTDSRLEFAGLSLLRPQESPHLAVLATVVLRV